jgi:hypothetical protein
MYTGKLELDGLNQVRAYEDENVNRTKNVAGFTY